MTDIISKPPWAAYIWSDDLSIFGNIGHRGERELLELGRREPVLELIIDGRLLLKGGRIASNVARGPAALVR